MDPISITKPVLIAIRMAGAVPWLARNDASVRIAIVTTSAAPKPASSRVTPASKEWPR